IFVGGCIRWVMDRLAEKRGLNPAQRTRVENVGILSASGMIAGEALMGLITAYFAWKRIPLPAIFHAPSYFVGIAVMALTAFMLVRIPLANGGRADEPAPPAAIM